MHIMFLNTRVMFIITTDITIYGEAATGFILIFMKDRGRRLLRLWYRFYLRYFRDRRLHLLGHRQDSRVRRLQDLQDRRRDLQDRLRDLQDRLRDLQDRLRDLQDRLRAEAGIVAGKDIYKILES